MTENYELKCCICLTEQEIKDPNRVSYFKCFTCKEGFVCNSCMADFDPYGSVFLETKREVLRAITCPCCRSPNWKYHYNQLVRIIFQHDLWEQDNWGQNKAIDLFLHNYAIKENCCVGCGDPNPTIIASNEAPMCEECWT